MATGPAVYDMSSAETRLNWERELFAEVAKRTALMNPSKGFVGDSETSVIQRKKRVFEEGGSRATIILDRNLRQSPTFGNQTLRDREEGLRTSTFNFEINQIRHAVAVNGRMTQQRVPFDVWKRSIRRLGEYWPQILEAGMFLHLCGVPYDVSNTLEWYHKGDQLAHTFSNTPTAPDSKHIYRVNQTTDELVGGDPSAILDLNIGSTLKAMAKTLPIPIRPALIHDQELYVLFVHPWQVRHLKQNSRWLARMRDTLKGGAINGNPLWTGALGIDDEVLWVESPYVCPGVNSSTNARVTNARRAVFCGAQAGVIGLAKDYEDENTFKNVMENWDYENNKGWSAAILAGMAAPRFSVAEQSTTDDYGKIVCTSYAEAVVTSS